MANKYVNRPEAAKVQEEPTGSEAFFAKNKKAMLYVVAVIVIVIVGAVLYNNYVVKPNETKASTALAKGQDYFNAEMYEQALNGDSISFAGLLSVAEQYSGTDAANLANLYAGLSYAKLGKWQEAVTYLEKFKGKGDKMISPAAEGALGNAYAHIEQLDKAVEHLKKAAKMADNNSLSPTFLIQAGEILENQGKPEEALVLYQQVKDNYPNSMQYQTIDKYIERVTK